MPADTPHPDFRDDSLGPMVDALLDDQSRRWRRGEIAPVEAYLGEHPELGQSSEYLMDLIYHEVVLRSQRGEVPGVDEYVQRFPQLAEALRLQFQIHGAIAQDPDTAEAPAALPTHASAAIPAARGLGSLPQLPGYEIRKVIGRGGMGVVYEALQRGLNRLVALKTLRAGEVAPKQLERFRSESELIARLDHPNVVRVYEVGEHDGVPYFAMELVNGISLAQALRGTPLPAQEAAALIRTLADAIESVHDRDIIHRDLKPANILLQQAADGAVILGTPKITDFGLAKRVDAEDARTRSGEIVGTPSYMAPEQAAGRQDDVGRATDVYALGAILYEMLTGRPPFRADTVLLLLDQLLNSPPLPPRQLHATLDRDLETICLKCLHKEPARRYARAADLADDLQRYLAREPIRARAATWWETSWQSARRHPTVAAAVTTAAAVLIVLTTGYYLHLRAALAEAVAARDLEAAIGEGSAQLHLAETAVQAEQWQRAAQLLAEVPARLEPAGARFPADARLANLHQRAGQLRRLADQHLTDETRYRQLLRHRANVSFHAVGFTGLDAQRSVREMRAEVNAALALFGLTTTAAEPLPLSGTSYTAAQQERIADCCLEMLVNLADTLGDAAGRAQPPAAQPLNDEALALLDRAAALPGPGPSLSARRARLQAGRGGNDPGPAPVRATEFFLAGTLAYRLGDLAKAADCMQQALQREPDNIGAQYALAVCCLRQRAGQSGANRLHVAVYRLSQCVDAQPDLVWPYLLRGYAHGELDDFTSAEADFARVERDGAADDIARYGVYVNRGLMRIRQGKLAEAGDDLRRAVEVLPAEYAAYANLAQVYQEQQRWEEARVQLDRALDRSPEGLKATLYRTRARLHQAQGQFAAALRDYDEALRRDERSAAVPGSLLEQARILVQQGEHAKALAALDRAVALQPSLTAAHRLRAEALLHLNRFAEAVQALDVCLGPGAGRAADGAAYVARGRARSALGKFADAVDDYTHAVALQPDSAAAHANRGWAYVVLEAPVLALRDFDRVVALEPDSADGHNGRGYALARLGRYREAVVAAEQALKLSPARNSRNTYNACRTHVQAAVKAEEDRLLAPARMQELRRDYQRRALELLEQTLDALPSFERGSFWKRTVTPDPALAPMRRHPRFLELSALYREAAQGGQSER